MNDVIDQYQRALTALNPIQRQQALTQIFGQDAIRAATILIRGGSAALIENTKAANQNGAANRLAQGNAKGLNGAFQSLSNSLSNLGLDLGNVVKGPLTDFINGAANAITELGKFAEAATKAGHTIKNALNDITPSIKLPGEKKGQSFGGFLLGGLLEPGKGIQIASQLAAAAVARKVDPLEKGKTDKQIKDAIDTANKYIREHQRPESQRGAGISGGTPTAQPGNDEGLAPLTAEQKKTEQKAVAAAIARNAIKKANKDITAPLDLQNADLQAQLNNNLQQELTADKAIENYFEERLKSAVKGTARYTKILAALVAAHAQTTSIQTQITSNAKQARDKAVADAKQAAADAKAAAQAAFQLGKSTLDLAIQNAGQTPGVGDDIAANQAEVSFFQRQIAQVKKHTKLTVEMKQTITDDQAAILSLKATIDSDTQAQKQALFNLEKSRLDLAIQQAGLTKGTGDDIRANEAEISLFRRAIARIEAIKKHRKLTLDEKQAIIDDQSAIAGLQATIQGIKQQNGGGFTVGDLFKEAASEFTSFGSNIAQRGGLLSGQDARASFAARVLNKASAQQVAKVIAGEQAQRDKAQLTEAQKQTQLLRGIYGVLGGPQPGRSPKPSTEAIHRARELARSGNGG